MDAFLVKGIVSELGNDLAGALVSKVHQPAERDIVITLWTGRGERRLLLSAHPELCRIHLTTRRVPNPPVPPRFCQFLRRHLEGMRVETLSAAAFDRLVRLDFRSTRPDALHGRTTLYAELFGRHANLIYVDGDGTVLAPLRAVSPEESRIREVAPGIPYRPLPPPARPFLDGVTPALAGRMWSLAWEGLDRVLTREISGLGREVAREVAARGGESADALHGALREMVRRYEAGDFEPGIGTLPTGKKRLLPFPCPGAGFVAFAPFPAANEAADAYYGEVARDHEDAVLRQKLSSRLSALLKKERHTRENVADDEERLRAGLEGGAHGETLKANLEGMRKGMTEFEGIPLDPSKTPVENMNRYFRLYRKAKGAVETVRNRKREIAEAVYYLESLEAQLSGATTRDELLAIRQELSAAYPPKTPRRKKSAPREEGKRAPGQVEERRIDGYTVLIGRNNTGNDRIVRELAAPDDLWLHVQGIPGSHVLLKRPAGREVPGEILYEAARLAVLHSKARGSQNVPVFLAEARHVSRFKGAKPGLVRIAKYRTINVR